MRYENPRWRWRGCVAAIFAAGIAVLPRAALAGANWNNAAQAYDEMCAYCHEPGVGPMLAPRKQPLTAARVREVVRHGYRAMPAFRRTDVDDDILDGMAKFIGANKLP